MDPKCIKDYVGKVFDTDVLPALMNFIRIPNVSPGYDPAWKDNKYLYIAGSFIAFYAQSLNLQGAKIELLMDEGKSPFVFVDVAATRPNDDRTIMMYGHFDKQPPFVGWDADKGPYTPVVKDGFLYGRGTVDDGYAPFAALIAIKYCQMNNLPLPRICVCIEGNEESGEEDLRYYILKLKSTLGKIALFIGMDAGCDDYDRLWVTTSLRGCLNNDMTISTIKEDLPYDSYSGIVPDPFLAFRKLFDKIQNDKGEVLIPGLSTTIPDKRIKEAEKLAEIVGNKYIDSLPLAKPTKPMNDNIVELILNKTWRPSFNILGCDNGIPTIKSEKKVIPKSATIRFNIRIPPHVNGEAAQKSLVKFLKDNAPFKAKIEVKNLMEASGWELNKFSTKLETLLNQGSKLFYGNESAYRGEGGSIPFIGYFESLYPECDIANLGISGTDSSDHGPNEKLHLSCYQKFIMCMIYLIGNY